MTLTKEVRTFLHEREAEVSGDKESKEAMGIFKISMVFFGFF